MKAFDYQRPDTLSAALDLLGAPRTVLLGGGTNLVDLMKIGVSAPDVLVDVSHLPLDAIELTADGVLRAGATARNSELAAHPGRPRRVPGAGAGAAGRRVRAAAQLGHHGGQPAAAHPLPVLHGRRQTVQQARARHGVPGA